MARFFSRLSIGASETRKLHIVSKKFMFRNRETIFEPGLGSSEKCQIWWEVPNIRIRCTKIRCTEMHRIKSLLRCNLWEGIWLKVINGLKVLLTLLTKNSTSHTISCLSSHVLIVISCVWSRPKITTNDFVGMRRESGKRLTSGFLNEVFTFC